MVLTYEEEMNLQQKKFECKQALLEKQHAYTMAELEGNLKIEAVKCYHSVVDEKIKEAMTKIIFDEEGREVNASEQ